MKRCPVTGEHYCVTGAPGATAQLRHHVSPAHTGKRQETHARKPRPLRGDTIGVIRMTGERERPQRPRIWLTGC